MKCNGLVGLLFGHKFEARYNSEEGEGKWPFKEGSLESQITSTNQNAANIISCTKNNRQTYIQDVCKRCGMVIEKKS